MDYLVDIGRNPDWGMDVEYTMAIDEVKLGDGYTQRRPKGINPIVRVYSPTWTGISSEEKDTLVDFLRSTYGVYPFIFKDPGGDDRPPEEVKVTCSTKIGVNYAGYKIYNVAATFTEDFNP